MSRRDLGLGRRRRNSWLRGWHGGANWNTGWAAYRVAWIVRGWFRAARRGHR